MSVCDFALHPDTHWKMTPAEWWPLWSWKFGPRAERAKSHLAGVDVRGMRQELDNELEDERSRRAYRGS